MKNDVLIKLHDIAVEQRFLSTVSELAKAGNVPRDANGMQKILRAAVSEANGAMKEHLQLLVGEEETQRILRQNS